MRLADWCPVLHEAEFRIVQRLGTNLQHTTNSAICRMDTSPPTPTPTQFIAGILFIPFIPSFFKFFSHHLGQEAVTERFPKWTLEFTLNKGRQCVSKL